ncbi:hypothetical protein TUM19329_28590 [Legionella antarctica]|uniref:Uncharacterized protein n=1 Tax=Legionella antarctica TaxID=2708020 RepID=A0A6F8T7V6_9GAMM|nr:hypothetical protein TUM19329_28590 [Legionella antarctica]
MMKRQEIKQVLDELTKDIDSLADKKAVTMYPFGEIHLEE